MNFLTSLPSDTAVINAPRSGERWIPVLRDKTSRKIYSIQKRDEVSGDIHSNPLALWANPLNTTSNELLFCTTYRAFIIKSFSSVEKFFNGLSIFRPEEVADIGTNCDGAMIVATSRIPRLVNGHASHNTQFDSKSCVHPSCSHLSYNTRHKLVAHTYSVWSADGSEYQFIDIQRGQNPLFYKSNNLKPTQPLHLRRTIISRTAMFIALYSKIEQPIEFFRIKSDGTIQFHAVIEAISNYKMSSLSYGPIAWHPNRNLIAIAYIVRGVPAELGFRIFDLDSPEPTEPILDIITDHTGFINCIDWSPDGRYIATGSRDSSIFIYDLLRQDGGKLLGHRGWVSGLAFSPDSQRLASSGNFDCICIWSVEYRHQVAQLRGDLTKVKGPPWHKSGRMLLAGCVDVYELEPR
jgi:WD40 repeat protein